MTHSEHDVLVAGAGPAGAHLALRLAAEGRSVGLVDRCEFPRPKPCGEFLSPECHGLLDEVGLLEAALSSGATPVGGIRLSGFASRARGSYRGVGSARARFDQGLGLRRERLDLAAVELARAHPAIEVLTGHDVVGVERGAGERVRGLRVRDAERGERTLLAPFVVGADGTRGRVSRSLGWSAPPTRRRWSLVARFRGVPRDDFAEVHLLDGAYFAACPIDGEVFTANLVLDQDRLRPGPRGLEALFAEHVARAPELARRLAAAELVEPIRACGPLAVRVTRRTGPGVALVGDAAGFVDPLTGEGLYFAMRGAALLTESVLGLLRDPSTEPRRLREYERRRRREFGGRYAFARLLQVGLRHPGLVRRALSLLEARPGLADLAVTWTGDSVAPRALMRPATWHEALSAPARVA